MRFIQQNLLYSIKNYHFHSHTCTAGCDGNLCLETKLDADLKALKLPPNMMYVGEAIEQLLQQNK